MQTQYCRNLALVLMLTLTIQGCSLFGPGSSKYVCPRPDKGVCKSARAVYQQGSVILPSSSTHLPVEPPDRSQVITEEHVQRTPAQILRIWVAPWVDRQGNWHSGDIIMTDIAPRDWHSALPVHTLKD